MNYTGYLAYDDDDFFEKYHQRRRKDDAPNELIEKPIIDELLGDVSGKNILDLGCGDGKYGIELLKRSAKYYQGIDGSQNMVSLAKKNLENYNVEIEKADIEQIEIQGEFDIVISRLVLHYIEDLDSLFEKIRATLKDNGVFIFSIEHPVITSNYESYHNNAKRGNWIVDNYFDSGERINNWLGKKVVKHHKTLEAYWKIIREANFQVLELRESKPNKLNFESEEEYLRRKRIPLFLIFKLRK
ncbi:class I SAM-dependent methyltransferase [Flavobacteriaceae bacterium MHTCC 0001]